MNTDREIEIQEMAICVLPQMEELAMSQLGKLNNSMELCYYLRQLVVRLEIIANLRYGVSEGGE